MKIVIKDNFSEWSDFVALSDVDCGFWCDPVVVTQLSGDVNDLRIVYVYDDGRPVAVLPFQYTASTIPFMLGLWRLGGMRARMLKLPDYEFPVKCGYERKVLFSEVVSWLKREKICDLIMADNWPTPDKGARNIQTTYLIDMPDSFDDWMGQLSSNTRQMLRRRVRKLSKECERKISVKVFRDREDMELLHKYLQSVWKCSWHGRLGRQEPPTIEFLESMAGNGWVRSYILFAGDIAIASVQGYQYKNVFMDEAPAYDDAWKKYSPGLVLNYYIMDELFKSDTPKVVDFGFGYNQYKEILGTRAEVRGQFWQGMSFRGNIIKSILKICDFSFKTGKIFLGKCGLDKKIKAKLQKGI